MEELKLATIGMDDFQDIIADELAERYGAGNVEFDRFMWDSGETGFLGEIFFDVYQEQDFNRSEFEQWINKLLDEEYPLYFFKFKEIAGYTGRLVIQCFVHAYMINIERHSQIIATTIDTFLSASNFKKVQVSVQVDGKHTRNIKYIIKCLHTPDMDKDRLISTMKKDVEDAVDHVPKAYGVKFEIMLQDVLHRLNGAHEFQNVVHTRLENKFK